MEKSLSVVLPVRNAAPTLARHVDQLLEVLPEVADNFELLIIDDGSTDATEEVACELIRAYPQLRFTRHPQPGGQAAVVETALRETRGDVLLVQDENRPISTSEIRKLWQLRNDDQLLMARATVPPPALPQPAPAAAQPVEQSHQAGPPSPQAGPASPQGSIVGRLVGWANTLKQQAASDPAGGIQMIRRDALDQIDLRADQRQQRPPSPAAPPRPARAAITLRPNLLPSMATGEAD